MMGRFSIQSTRLLSNPKFSNPPSNPIPSIFNILKISSIELKKSRRKYSKASFLAVFLISLISVSLLYFAMGSGIKSDAYLYEVSGVWIDDYRFITVDKNPDIYVTPYRGGYKAFVTGSDKSLAAADELRKIIQQNHEVELYQKFGAKAFPVFVKAEFLERGIKPRNFATNNSGFSIPIERKVSEVQSIEGVKGTPAKNPEKIVSESLKGSMNLPINQKTGYTTPNDFNPQSLLGKMFLAFFFIIPSYFMIQLFSASMLEDKTLRRLDVLLSSPVKPVEIYLGKMLPYLTFSIFLILSTSFILNKSLLSLLFVFPFILFVFSLQTYIVLLSRSYKEMTFLIMVSSFIITAYLFIPAIFSGTIPVSKISPITNMLSLFETGEFDLNNYILSTSQFYVLFAVLSFTSLKMMSPEIMHSKSGIERKILASLQRWIKNPLDCLFASILSIPFVFITEFMLISVIFTMPLRYSIPAFILAISLVEELFKTSIVYSAYKNSGKLYLSSLLTALGFFAGEKVLAVVEIGKNYMNLLLAGYLLLPLALHLVSLLAFTILIKRKGYAYAFALAVLVHFIYDYGILLVLGGAGL